MKQKLNITVLISTIGQNGIVRVSVMNLPEMDGVDYVVAWQNSGDCKLPVCLANRGDIQIVRNPGIGLSQNRNFLLDMGIGDIVVISDDDLNYEPEYFEAVRRIYETNPGVDIALFRYCNNYGSFEKMYPSQPVKIGHKYPKDYFVSSVEITFRRNVRTENLRFREEFGLGAPLFGCGEEEIFIRDAIRKGCEVWFFPQNLCIHAAETTGTRRITDRRVYWGIGASTAYTQPLLCFLRFPVIAMRGAAGGKMRFFPALAGLYGGAVYALTKVFPKWKKEEGGR